MLNTVLKGGLLMPHWHVVDDCFLLQNYEWEYFVCENDCTFISNTHRGVQFFPQILSEVLMRRILPKVTQLSCKKYLQKYQHRLFKIFFLLLSHAVLWRLPWWWLQHFFQQFCNAFHCLWDLSTPRLAIFLEKYFPLILLLNFKCYFELFWTSGLRK